MAQAGRVVTLRRISPKSAALVEYPAERPVGAASGGCGRGGVAILGSYVKRIVASKKNAGRNCCQLHFISPEASPLSAAGVARRGAHASSRRVAANHRTLLAAARGERDATLRIRTSRTSGVRAVSALSRAPSHDQYATGAQSTYDIVEARHNGRR